jgi:hypothetical protein
MSDLIGLDWIGLDWKRGASGSKFKRVLDANRERRARNLK